MTAQVAQMIQYTNVAGQLLPAVVRATPETYTGHNSLPEGQLEITVFGSHCDYRRRAYFDEAAGMATPVPQDTLKSVEDEDEDEGLQFGNGTADD